MRPLLRSPPPRPHPASLALDRAQSRCYSSWPSVNQVVKVLRTYVDAQNVRDIDEHDVEVPIGVLPNSYFGAVYSALALVSKSRAPVGNDSVQRALRCVVDQLCPVELCVRSYGLRLTITVSLAVGCSPCVLCPAGPGAGLVCVRRTQGRCSAGVTVCGEWCSVVLASRVVYDRAACTVPGRQRRVL